MAEKKRTRWQRRPGTTGGKLPWNDWRNATTWRKATQLLLLAMNIYIAITFWYWVRYYETASSTTFVARPGGIEGWLPIAGLMNLKYSLVTGQLPSVHAAAMLLLVAFIVISLLLKKAFCSWLCPVGTLSELIGDLGNKLFGRQCVLPRWLDIPLRGVKYSLLSFFLYIALLMTAQAIHYFMLSPYSVVMDVKMLVAIPAATDIAFALGVLALLGSRVPLALKIFLMALAIIDDLGAIIIIALFYTNDLSMASLGVAAVAIAVLAVLNLCGVRRTGVYILVGVVLWTAVLKSGVHATLAGVIVGFFIPLKEKHGRSPAKRLEHVLHPWVAYLILPLFAFANAGVSLQGVTLDGLTSILPLGIIAGLLIGKPLGISLFCWLALRLKLAHLPEGTTYQQIMAVGILCGIGFTMSIFIASLAFGSVDPELINWAKLGILVGSISSAVIGYSWLRVRLRPSV